MPSYSYNSVIIARELNLDGRLLSGGKVYTYDINSTTPKRTFATYDGSVVNTNPVILDASGSADIYLDGAYKIVVTDQYGVQIGVKNGVFGTALSAAVTEPVDLGTSVVVDTYSDVRALQGTYDTVYVCGRTTPGDGGAGWLRLDPLATYIDDNAVTLVSTNGNHYTRDNITQLDPRWFGVQYDSGTDQATLFADACNASIKYKVPVVVEDKIYITSNFNVLAGVSVRLVSSGAFTSAVVATINFNPGSAFEGRPLAFLDALQPIFITSQAVYLSWMGAQTAEAKMAKAIAACSSYNTVLYIDSSLTLSMNLVVPANVTFTQYGSNITSFPTTGNLTISVPNIVINGSNQFFDINTITADVDLGDRFALPEWFGAIGDGTTDDSIPLKACFSHGKVLINRNSYAITDSVSTSDSIIINSDCNSSIIISNSWAITNLDLSNINIVSPNSHSLTVQNLLMKDTSLDPNIHVVCQNIWAVNSSMDVTLATITGNNHLAGVKDTFVGISPNPSVWNDDPQIHQPRIIGPAYLSGLEYGKCITTDDVGKIVNTIDQPTRCAFETIPRGMNSIECYYEIQPNTKRTFIVPVLVTNNTYALPGDLLTVSCWKTNTNPLICLGMMRLYSGNFYVLSRSNYVQVGTTYKITTAITDTYVTNLYAKNTYFMYISMFTDTAMSTIFLASGATLLANTIFGSYDIVSNDTSRYNVGDMIPETTPTLLNTPYISLKPGA